ncbi:MAG TPA: hypothetical protein VF916_02805, partial [Ktedonobacterales bacterium]
MARKHGNGEGTIRQRLDGNWEARVSLSDGQRKSLYGKTRAEVAQKLTAMLRDRDQGPPLVADKQTVAQYLASWLEDIRPNLKPQTWTRYAGEVRNHLAPAVGSV